MIWSIFLCACWPSVFLLGKMCIGVLHFFLIGLFGFLVLTHMSSSYILGISPLLDKSFMNILSHTIGCLFVLFCCWCPLLYRSFSTWCSPTYSLFYFVSLARGDQLLMLIFERFLPMFSLPVLWFYVLHLGLWSISSLLLCVELDSNAVSVSCM